MKFRIQYVLKKHGEVIIDADSEYDALREFNNNFYGQDRTEQDSSPTILCITEDE